MESKYYIRKFEELTKHIDTLERRIEGLEVSLIEERAKNTAAHCNVRDSIKPCVDISIERLTVDLRTIIKQTVKSELSKSNI